MSVSAFEWTSEQLEAHTDLSRIEARGTVRLALKAAGFDPRKVSPDEMAAVLRKVMPAELDSRGIAEAEAVCEKLAGAIGALESAPGADTPEQIFARLGR